MKTLHFILNRVLPPLKFLLDGDCMSNSEITSQIVITMINRGIFDHAYSHDELIISIQETYSKIYTTVHSCQQTTKSKAFESLSK